MDDLLTAFLGMASAMGGGGNKGNGVPIDDVMDLRKGANYIPGEVTMARRRDERVVYFPDKKEWQMPDGSIVK